MAQRYTRNRRGSSSNSQVPRKNIQPERAPIKKTRGTGRGSRFNLLLIIAVLVVIFLVVEPYINKTPNENGVVIENPSGENQIVENYPIISEVMSANRNALASEDGEYYDWIELYNPTQKSINLNGFALSDDLNEPAKFVLPVYILEPDSFVVFFASGKAIDSKFHAGFKISSQGETIFLSDPYSNIKDQVLVAHMSPNFSYQRDLTNTSSWTASELFSPGHFNDEGGHQEYIRSLRATDSVIKISEVMSSNLITITDEDGDYSDWIELTNKSDAPVDISGYALSDNESAPRDWLFPDGTIINPGEYLLVFLSGKDKVGKNGELHASFRLNSMKDTVLCANVQGKILDIWDVIEPGNDVSIEIVPGSGIAQFTSHPTPGYENTEDGYNQFQQEQNVTQSSGLIISEIMLGNEVTIEDNFGEFPDWIELYNNTEERISLAGYGLSDEPALLGKWTFPDKAYIDPGQYKVIFASGRDTPKDSTAVTLHTNFSFNATGEPVILTNSENKIIDKCVLSTMPYDISYGRTSQSKIFQYMLAPSPGEPNSDGYSGIAQTPYIQLKGGVYADTQVISIAVPEGCTVRYTTDCSEPSERSNAYSGPFEINKSTVIRARSFQDGKIQSEITTQSYFLNVNHKLPIVSISTDPNNLYSDHAGILAFGDGYKTKYPFKASNFHQDWEVPAHIEMYEIDGSQVLNQGFGLRVFGAYSRAEISKNFALMAREKYGEESFNYAVFPDRPYESYKSLIIRNGASEWYASKIRDTTLTSLARDTTDLDVQAYYPVVFYLNGEFWGVYFLREKINKYYLNQHHGIDIESVDIIYGNGNYSSNAVTGDIDNWQELKEYVTTHDLSVEENYKVVEDWVDVQNYMDMVINEVYVGNTDTGNIKCYREKKDGAKWRWFYYDVDWGFFSVDTNSLTQYLNPEGHGNGDAFETWLILGLLENDGFRQAFIERFAYHMKITYDPDWVIARIDHIASLIDHDMVLDRETWNQNYKDAPQWYKEALGGKAWSYARSMSYESWTDKQLSRLRTFAQKRPILMEQYLQDYFDISDEEMTRLFG